MASAVELFQPEARGPLVLCCEHASSRLPAPLRASTADQRWLGTHWGVDIGAAEVTRAIAERCSSPALLSRVSRLVCDANRDPTDPTWIRTEVEGQPIRFNQGLSTAERERRLRLYHQPYHAALSALAGSRPGAALLLSVHSFTPNYMGQVREVEVGVLYDEHEELAHKLLGRIAAQGWRCALNEPWSGKDGLIHSPQQHGRAAGLPYLELELRQDLIRSDRLAQAVARRVWSSICKAGL
jgi:predicted N-formylglutamate amidohydrolase